jgi:hypothetical protein
MTDKSQEVNPLFSQLQLRVQQLEKFRDEEVKPFMDQTAQQLETVQIEQETQKESLVVFKKQIKDIEKRLSCQGLKEVFLIGLCVSLIMYIIIILLI